MTTLRDFMAGHLGATITCALTGNVVRRLAVNPDNNIVDIDAITDQIGVPLDTVIFADVWCMDRASICFDDMKKLCTQYDIVTYEDGSIVHANAEESE